MAGFQVEDLLKRLPARLPDGSFRTRLSACYPASMATGIATCLAPALSSGSDMIPIADWESLLPAKLLMPRHTHRIEDGAGTQSTACWTPSCP